LYKLSYPKNISENFKNFLSILLAYDPKRRNTNVSTITNHPWLAGIDWKKVKNGDWECPFDVSKYDPNLKEIKKEVISCRSSLDNNEKKLFEELAKLCKY
jgi:serine/threonine protein kinase